MDYIAHGIFPNRPKNRLLILKLWPFKLTILCPYYHVTLLDWVQGVSWSSLNGLVASANSDKLVRIWDLREKGMYCMHGGLLM